RRAPVARAPAVDPTALRPPRIVAIVQGAPPGEVLGQAALAIPQGGHGTAMKALAAGVPMVVLPHGRDQADTAARVTAAGAGVALARTASRSAISRAVRRVLQHDSYRGAARRLGEVIRRDGKENTLMHELEALAATDRLRNDANGLKRIDRRQFRVTNGSTILLGLAGGAWPRAESRPPLEEFRSSLPIPPVLSPVRSDSAA